MLKPLIACALVSFEFYIISWGAKHNLCDARDGSKLWSIKAGLCLQSECCDVTEDRK